MANRPTPKPPASKSIFINCPFDDGFKPILRAMVFTIISSGFHPRCALDSTDGAEVRVSKIARMIGECDWGIHDLSRIELDPGARVPRFNMPMELGLHLGARLFGRGRHRRKRALILEAEPHRYDAALSDISGQDVEIHATDPVRAIRCVRNWLSEHRGRTEPPLPGTSAIANDYLIFQAEVDALLGARRLDPLDELTHSDFLFAVRDWIATRASVPPQGYRSMQTPIPKNTMRPPRRQRRRSPQGTRPRRRKMGIMEKDAISRTGSKKVFFDP